MAANLVFCGGQKEKGWKPSEGEEDQGEDEQEEEALTDPADEPPVFHTLHSVHSTLYLAK